jgi:transcription antitermination factor NusG
MQVDARLVHPWFAVQVRTRAEPTIDQCLKGKGYETFLPTVPQSRRYPDRIKVVNIAMFPGYLFCRLDVLHRLPILTTPGVDSIIGPAGVPEAIPDAEIVSLMNLVGSGIAAKPWPYLQTGDRVQIVFGSFAGAEGLLVNEKGVDRLVVSISLLQRSVAFEIDRAWVRPAEKTRRKTLAA